MTPAPTGAGFFLDLGAPNGLQTDCKWVFWPLVSAVASCAEPGRDEALGPRLGRSPRLSEILGESRRPCARPKESGRSVRGGDGDER